MLKPLPKLRLVLCVQSQWYFKLKFSRFSTLPVPGRGSAFSALKFQHLTILVLRMSREREPRTGPLWSEIGLCSSLDLCYFGTSSFMSQEDTRWKSANDQQLHLGRHCHWARGRNIYFAAVLHMPYLAATPVGGLGALFQVPQKGGFLYPRVWRRQSVLHICFPFDWIWTPSPLCSAGMPGQTFSFDWQVLAVSGFE